MSERDKVSHFPNRAEVEQKLVDLIEGRVSRDDAEDWAMAVDKDNDRAEVTDWPAWEALNALMGAAAITTDRPYLYGEEDFKDWLAQLRATPKP